MNNNKRKRIVYLVVLLILIISIGYAVLTTVFNVNSSVSLSKVSFNIHFDNVVVSDDNKAEVTEGNDARITNDAKTEITFAVSLKKLGDYYSFTTDIVNEGSIPGKVKSIELNGISDSQKKLLKYNVYYTDNGRDIKAGDYIGPESTRNITVDLEYNLDNDISNDDMLLDDITIECTLVIRMENGTLSEYRSRAASNRLMQDISYVPSSSLVYTNSTSSDEHEGIYRLDDTVDDDFPIYFYRGGHEKVKNHVMFGGYCWRIIRTTSTGGIKIIYNGEPTNGTCINHPTSSDNVQLPDHAYNSDGGRMFGGSSISRYLGTWYFENLITFQAYLEDTPFCSNMYDNGNISLECDSESESSVSNGKLLYPIGLITGQEANMCGMSTNGSSYPWLYNGKNYWTISGVPGYSYNIWYVTSGGGFGHPSGFGSYGTQYAGVLQGVRPVISLNSDVVFNEGDGTSTNPYIPSLG